MAKAKKLTPKELYWARKAREEQETAAQLPPGLVNHGNTCFMNSVMQGLIATSLLENIIRSRAPPHPSIQTSAFQRSPLMLNGRGPEDMRHEWVQGMSIGDVFVHTLEQAWRMRDSKDRSNMSSKELLTRLGKKYDQYLDFRQQDAHEYFLHLLDGMRMEEFDIIKQRQPRPSKPSKRRARAGYIEPAVPDAIPEEDRLIPFVDMLWGGKFTSVVICTTCKNVSHTSEDFDHLSLSINHDEAKERKRDKLRAFASKFISYPNRERPGGHVRRQSASQPPSPSTTTPTLEPLQEDTEHLRRRSFDARMTLAPPDSEPERRKVDIFTNFKIDNTSNEHGSSDSTSDSLGSRSWKASEDALGKLGRRFSVGMSLGVRKEKKAVKVEQEHKPAIAENTRLNGINGKYETLDRGRTTASQASSLPGSRNPSPTPKRRPAGHSKLPQASEHDAQKAAYLRRLLEDTTPTLSNPLAALRLTNSNGSGSSTAWSKISPAKGVEECLRMFTAVEALDGDNVFGCRNCWKIANGQIPVKTPQSEEDSDDSSNEGGEGPREQVSPESLQSVSMPNLPPNTIEVYTASPLSKSAMSSPYRVPFIPIMSESKELNTSTLDLSLRPSTSASVSTSSLPTTINTLGSSLHDKPILQGVEPSLPSGESQEYTVPTIAPIAPPTDSIAFPPPALTRSYTLNNLNDVKLPSQDSLRLPEIKTRHHHHQGTARDGGSSASSDDSDHDDTSVVSDTSLAAGLRPVEAKGLRRSSIPRSKQVIYRRALKRYLIAQPPPILVIHLKRFQQVSKSSVTLFGNLKKLDDFVSFPEHLDIRPFLAPRKEDYGLGRGDLRGKVAKKGKRQEDQPCVYRLYAVVVHIGNMLGGHYIAYTALPSSKEPASSSSEHATTQERPANESTTHSPAPEKGIGVDHNKKQERQWCYISDTVVRLVTLDEVLKAKAYLCMYERVANGT